MMIKATRIRASAGALDLARHLTEGDENEKITLIRGTVAGLHDAVEDAKRFNRLYALRHFIISPQLELTREQFEKAAKALGDEFGFDHLMALTVEHRKSRADPSVSPLHWHLVVAETNAITGHVLSSSFSHPRHEKVARILELEFGHPIVPGAHDAAVLAALHGTGRTDLADRLSESLGRGPKPVAAYSVEAHQTGKRNGVDLAVARQNIRAAWANSANGEEFRSQIATHGLELAMGDKPGVTVIRHLATGVVLGAANRLAGVRRQDFNDFLERTDHDHRSHPAKSGPADPHGHAGASSRRGNHLDAGQGHGVADGRRGGVGPDGDGQSSPDDRDKDRGERPGHPGDPSDIERAGHRSGSASHAGCGLTQAVAAVGASVLALSRSTSIISQAERTRLHLARHEAQARAKVAAAAARPEQVRSSRLNAALLYRDGTHRRHAELLKAYRTAQERLAGHPEPRRSFADRMLGRQPDSAALKALERDVDTARNDLMAGEKMAAGADANLARVEKTEAAERMQELGRQESQRRAALDVLGEILMAQRIVKAYPTIVHCGPVFVGWSGGKIERKRRRGLRNPGATNIWGIPLDFGS